MAELVFIANLLMAILAVVLCEWRVWGSRDRLMFLGVGIIYGVLLEWIVIQQFAAFQYNADDF